MNPHFNTQREEKAIAHTLDMSIQYADEIAYSIDASIIYNDTVDLITPVTNKIDTEIIVDPITTTDAILKYAHGYCAALNFASFKYPGGGFIKGSIAQEEALCHDSYLYNVIGSDKFKPYYDKNRNSTEKLNFGLYTNFGIYSPHIIFEKFDTFGSVVQDAQCDIITVAAPNLSAYKNGEDVKYISTMHSRCKFVLDIAKENHIDTLILGAFGCGVFKNDPTFVSTVFKELLNSGNYNFKKVIFAIPTGPNYDAFVKTFN